MDRLELVSDDEETTERLAAALARVLAAGDVVLLEGSLGAGKTAFVRGVARGLGLPEDEPVTSPSFAVVQEYDTTPRLVHADLYRLHHSDELHQLGLEGALDGASVAFIEWGLGHADALGRVDMVVAISGSGDDSRHVVATSRSSRGNRMLDDWAALAHAGSLW